MDELIDLIYGNEIFKDINAQTVLTVKLIKVTYNSEYFAGRFHCKIISGLWFNLRSTTY